MSRLETRFGQSQSKSQTFCNLFNAIDERLWGVSYLQVIYSGLFNVYQLTIMTYTAAFFYKSFSSDAPWYNQSETSVGEAFFDMKTGFYPGHVLNSNQGSSVVGPLVACLFICVCFVLASVFKGVII